MGYIKATATEKYALEWTNECLSARTIVDESPYSLRWLTHFFSSCFCHEHNTTTRTTNDTLCFFNCAALKYRYRFSITCMRPRRKPTAKKKRKKQKINSSNAKQSPNEWMSNNTTSSWFRMQLMLRKLDMNRETRLIQFHIRLFGKFNFKWFAVHNKVKCAALTYDFVCYCLVSAAVRCVCMCWWHMRRAASASHSSEKRKN